MEGLIKKTAEQLNNNNFDLAIQKLTQSLNDLKVIRNNNGNIKETIGQLNDLKFQTMVLETKHEGRNITKKELLIKIHEEMTSCYLKEKLCKKALESLAEIEILQDIVKEMNVTAIMLKARCFLMAKNLKKSYEYFKLVHENIVDKNMKNEVEILLKRIQMGMNEEQAAQSDLAAQIKEISPNLLAPLKPSIEEMDIELIPMDVSNEPSNASQKKANGVVKIYTLKSASSILSEFMTKYARSVPVYEESGVKKVSANTTHFTMACHCIGHTEIGIGPRKKKAKEVASQNMIKYLIGIGKLELTETVEDV